MSARPTLQRAASLRAALLFVGATVLGAALGIGAMFAGVGRLVRGAPPLAFGLALGAVLGLGCGIAQALVLRRWLGGAWRWAAATLGAWVAFWGPNLAGAFGRGVGVGGKVVEGLAHGALFGLILGCAQGLVLRRRVGGAAGWVGASVVGWSVGAALGDGVKAAVGGGPVDVAIGLLVGTAVTGAWLPSLRRHVGRPSAEARPASATQIEGSPRTESL